MKVSALMANRPDELPVEVSPLNRDQQFKAGDLKVENVTILTQKGAVICGVKSTRNSVAEAPAEE